MRIGRRGEARDRLALGVGRRKRLRREGLQRLDGVGIAAPQEADPLPAGVHLALAAQAQAEPLGAGAQRRPQEAAHLRVLQVDPVASEDVDAPAVPVALEAPGRLHPGGQRLADVAPLADRAAVPGVVPGAVIHAVRVDPGHEQVAFGARQVRDLAVVAAGEQPGQRGGARAVLAGREKLRGPERRAVHAVDARDPVGHQLGLAPAGEVLVADVEVLGPPAGEIHPGGDPFRAAVAVHAVLVQDRLNHAGVVQEAAAPGLGL